MTKGASSISSQSDNDSGSKSHDFTKKKTTKLTRLSLIYTNARSLYPKINSLIDCMNETDAHVAIVTESWLKDGQGLKEMTEELREGSGFGLLCRNRTPNANGVAYGGVSLLWKEGSIDFKEIELKNPQEYEVLAAAGSVPGQRRKMVILGCYIPPNYVKSRGGGAAWTLLLTPS